MRDVSRRAWLTRIVSTAGGLLAIGLLVIILVVVGKPIVARRTASGAPHPSTTPLQQAPLPSPTESTARAAPTPNAVDVLMPAETPSGARTRGLLTPTPVGAWISLSPDSGPPGTLVEVQGYLPNGPSPDQVAGNPVLGQATVCWTGCLSGFKEEAITVRWSSTEPGHFTMHVRVPAAPWLAANGPRALTPGDYAVGIQCLAPAAPKAKGPDFVPCGMQPAQATTTFHLTGPVPTLCANGPCAHLSFSPNQGPPGTIVQISGWAPLTGLFLDRPRGYTLVLQAEVQPGGNSSPEHEKASFPPSLGQVQQDENGNLSGSFQVPESMPSLGRLTPGRYTLALESFYPGAATTATPVAGATVVAMPDKQSRPSERITLAPTTFTITAASSWASLGPVAPLWSDWSAPFYAGPALIGDPTDPRRLAYCTAGGIRVSSDGGSTWTTIPTTGIIAALAPTPFQLFQPGALPPTCSAIILDPSYPRSFFATFAVLKKPQPSPPPENLVGLITTDGGQTWRVVPAPPGHTDEQFGGFQVAAEAVVALFHDNASTPGPVPFVAEVTTDGGRTWTTAHLPCPSRGPCARWGAAPSFVGGMGASYPQSIEVSSDGGQHWTTPTWPSQVEVRQGSSELVALSPTEVVLLSGSAPFPFLFSHDGGQTWEDIALPGLGPASEGVSQYPGLQMLPSGSLLTRGENPDYGWLMLTPGASQWCEVAGASPPASATSFRAIGDRLWWIQPGNTPAEPPTVGSVAISNLQCGQSISPRYLTPAPTPAIAPEDALRVVLDSPSVKGSSLFAIFPRRMSKQPCSIHGGGPAPGIAISGICATIVQVKGELDEVDFVESWNAKDFHAANDAAAGWLSHTWMFVVDRRGTIVKQAETGAVPPQEAK